MRFRDVEHFEVIMIVFNIRTLDDFVAQFCKGFKYFRCCLGNRMNMSDLRPDSRNGYVERFLLLFFMFLFYYFFSSTGKCFLNFFFELVYFFSRYYPFLARESRELLHEFINRTSTA